MDATAKTAGVVERVKSPMNLSDFYSMIFTSDQDSPETVQLFVFSSDEERESYRKNEGASFLLSISSIYILQEVLTPKYAKARVLHFYPFAADVVDVVIDKETQEEYTQEEI